MPVYWQMALRPCTLQCVPQHTNSCYTLFRFLGPVQIPTIFPTQHKYFMFLISVFFSIIVYRKVEFLLYLGINPNMIVLCISFKWIIFSLLFFPVGRFFVWKTSHIDSTCCDMLWNCSDWFWQDQSTSWEISPA